MTILKLRKKHDPALVVERATAAAGSAVYLLVANKPLPYNNNGTSKIVYIGKSDRGMDRVHESAAAKATVIFKTTSNPAGIHGVIRLSAYTFSFAYPANPGQWPWVPSVMLERAFLIRFKEIYGKPPPANDQRNAMKRSVEFTYFSDDAVEKVIKGFQ